MKAMEDGRFRGTIVGYFDGEHRAELAKVAAYWSGKAPGVYFTLNPVRPELLARANNRCKSYASDTTKDEEVLRRNWLLVDFDPKRPSGISATDEEKKAALSRARECRSWLTGQGWPEPILRIRETTTLLYRIDLPNDQATTALVKGVLEALASRFSDSAAEVDRSVFNAARICKLYGTLSAKGDATPERHHRISRMLEVPASVNVVARDVLELLVSDSGSKPSGRTAKPAAPFSGLNIEQWLPDHGFKVVRTKEYVKEDEDGTLYEIASCPWRPEEKDGGAFVIQWQDGTVTAGCHHNKCIGRGWPDLLALVEGGDNANKTDEGLVAIEAPDDPHRLARIVRDKCFRVAEGVTITYWRGQWYAYNGIVWTVMPEKELETRIVQAVKLEFDDLSRKAQKAGIVKATALKATPYVVRSVMLALRGMVTLDNSLEPPCWLGEPRSWEARDVFIAQNGLVHLPSLADGHDFLAKHTRDYFATHAVTYEVFPESPPIPQWLEFLGSLWPNDPESVALLQEWYGYCLTSDTRQQKILLLLGLPRSGKGTIAHILTELVGRPNVVTPTLASLSQNFGLQPWIDKSVAIFSDARLDGRMAKSAITERLLSISGGDSLTIDVKFGMPITTVLQTRIVIISNEEPQLKNASGAIAKRMLILRTGESFLGKENIHLLDDLKTELPGILRWAVEGWVQLRARGYFVEPESAAESRERLMGLSSPVKAFLDECCVVGPAASVVGQQLYVEYCEWLKRHGHTYIPNNQMFGRDLFAAVPGLVPPTRASDRQRRA